MARPRIRIGHAERTGTRAAGTSGRPQGVYGECDEVPYAEPASVECDHGNERAKTERLETIVLVGGVNDAQNVRWVEADASRPPLPVLPDDAFLDAESTATPEAPR